MKIRLFTSLSLKSKNRPSPVAVFDYILKYVLFGYKFQNSCNPSPTYYMMYLQRVSKFGEFKGYSFIVNK